MDTFKENVSEKCLLHWWCFKLFLSRSNILKENVLTVEKKPLPLVLPYLATTSLQTRTTLQKSIKGVFNYCKVRIISKSQNKLCNNFRFNAPVPQTLTSGVICKFQCGLCNEPYYGKCARHSTVISGEHIGISLLTNRRVPVRDNAVCHDLLNYNYSATFDKFSFSCRESNKHHLELKESLFIMRDRLSMNWNIRSTSLHLFEWDFVTLFAALCRLLWSVFGYFM